MRKIIIPLLLMDLGSIWFVCCCNGRSAWPLCFVGSVLMSDSWERDLCTGFGGLWLLVVTRLCYAVRFLVVLQVMAVQFSVFLLWLFVLFLFCVQVLGFYSIRFVAKGLLKEQIKVALDWNEENALCFCSWVCVADEANSDWTATYRNLDWDKEKSVLG